MANPRQRSKARSSATTARSLSSKRRLHRRQHKTPVMMGPGVLREGWDPKKTVFQNYEALGLLPSLPVAAGSRPQVETVQVTQLPKVQFGRIVRNEQGEVVDIIMPDDDEEDAGDEAKSQAGGVGGRGKPLNEEDEEVQPVRPKTHVARALETLASRPAGNNKPPASPSDLQWLVDLITAHGEDYQTMARDRGRNVWQKTEGEIRRSVKRAGGVGALRRTGAGVEAEAGGEGEGMVVET